MSGLPGIDSLATYGGAKVDEAPIADSTTDESAEHINIVKANVAGMTHTAARARCRFVGHASAPTDPVSNVHDAVWGDGVGVKPTVTTAGGGVYVLTWPATVTDALEVVHSVNFRDVEVSVEGATPYQHTESVTSPNVVTVRIFTAAGVADVGSGVTFAVRVF